MKHAWFILLCFLFSNSFAQEPELMQPYSNPLWLNPAATGGSNGKNINAGFRYLGPSWSASYSTLVAADLPFDQINSGLGFLFSDTRAPYYIFQRSQYMLSYAYAQKLGGSFTLSLGIRAGLIQTQINPNGIWFPPNTVPYPIKYEPTLLPSIGSGLVLSGKRFDLGLSMQHLNEPPTMVREGVRSRTPIFTQWHASYSFGTEQFSITPYLYVSYQGGFASHRAGAYLGFPDYFFGLAAKNSHTGLVTAGLNLNHLRLSYGFDFAVYRQSFNGGHEVMLSLLLPDKTERKKMKMMHHPIFAPIVE